MQLGSRFSNYALTGAFFCILHFLFLVVFNENITLEHWKTWVEMINGNLLPSTYHDTAETLLTTFGIISIFFIGMVLDLIGSYFFLLERRIFILHLKHNSDWLDQLSGKVCGSVEKDYKYLRDETTTLMWAPKELYEVLCNHGVLNHLQAYFFSYIHVNNGESVSDLLYEHRNLWRVSRAIANTLILLSLEMVVLSIHVTVFDTKINASIVLIGMFIVAAFLTLRSYTRMCYSLFSMTCTSLRKDQA